MCSLSDVVNLNLWAHDLTDVSILSAMPNVEVLSLSMNQITSLRDFSGCGKLRELYLRRNKVGNEAAF
jgi:cilla- and flagella-associated protein